MTFLFADPPSLFAFGPTNGELFIYNDGIMQRLGIHLLLQMLLFFLVCLMMKLMIAPLYLLTSQMVIVNESNPTLLEHTTTKHQIIV